MSSTAKEKIIIAVDAADSAAAFKLIDPLAAEGCIFKIGLQLFTAEGPAFVREIRSRGAKVFLDLKFHDIPNTAKEAVRSAVALGVEMTTIHLAGGPSMVAESVKAAEGAGTLVLGVTVLTSLSDADLNQIGVPHSAAQQVMQLAAMGVASGLRGVVASPLEIAILREKFGRSLTIVTPGVRPAGSDMGDQHRVLTPGQAIRLGADFLVIGRPITAAPSPRDAFLRIADEMAAAL